MGNWHISIQGLGCHHNKDNPTDADKLFADFVKSLKDAGHSIEHASFTHGGKVDLSPYPPHVNPESWDGLRFVIKDIQSSLAVAESAEAILEANTRLANLMRRWGDKPQPGNGV